jgi:hypothetical protein
MLQLSVVFFYLLASSTLTFKGRLFQWWAKIDHVKDLEFFRTSFNRLECNAWLMCNVKLMCGAKCQCCLWGLWLFNVDLKIKTNKPLTSQIVNISVWPSCQCWGECFYWGFHFTNTIWPPLNDKVYGLK